jgi:hypothetical protein
MAQLLAYAVIRHDPPGVFVAEDLDVLHWVLAIKLVAQTSAAEISPAQARSLRRALVEERWGDAVAEWIDITGVPVDVYDDLPLWTSLEVSADTAVPELQFTPLFAE